MENTAPGRNYYWCYNSTLLIMESSKFWMDEPMDIVQMIAVHVAVGCVAAIIVTFTKTSLDKIEDEKLTTSKKVSTVAAYTALVPALVAGAILLIYFLYLMFLAFKYILYKPTKKLLDIGAAQQRKQEQEAMRKQENANKPSMFANIKNKIVSK